MNDDQRLALLDRRAAAATAALDEAVRQVPVQEPDVGAPRRSVRRFLPLAVAAGLAVIALVGAALVFDDDQQSTIADQPGAITRLALPDPEALGYRILGAFDGDNPDDRLPRDLVIPVTVQSPLGAEDPWGNTVVSYSLPADATTLAGEPVDVGGPEATLDTAHGILSVGWLDEPRVYYLRSADMSAGELVALARSAATDRIADGEPLPGHEIIHRAPHTDVFPVLASVTAAAASRLDGILYESDENGFVVASGDGSTDRWRASFTLAHRVEHLTVRGHEAVLAEFDDALTEISWLEADGTLVRVDSFGGEIPVDVLEQLEPISGADFAALVEKFRQEQEDELVEERTHRLDEGEETDAPEPTLPDDDRTLISQVSMEENDIQIRATLLRWPDGTIGLETFSEGPNGGSAAAHDVPDVSSNIVIRDVVHSGGPADQGELVSGVIGPNVGPLRVIDAATGEPIEANGPSTATIDGSDHVVFLATVGPEYRDRDLVVAGTTATGEEIRLRAPARS